MIGRKLTNLHRLVSQMSVSRLLIGQLLGRDEAELLIGCLVAFGSDELLGKS